MMKEWGYQQLFDNNQRLLQMVFGASESLCCFDTYQFKDYAKVVADRFDPEKKARRRREVFPQDCETGLCHGGQVGQDPWIDKGGDRLTPPLPSQGRGGFCC